MTDATENNGLPQELILPPSTPGRGRPTSYLPEFCDRVIEWGRLGKSRAWMCAELMVVDQTMRNWEAAHPDFLEAMALALKKSQQWWEDKGQDNLETQGFQQSMYSRSMAARFPDDWREKTESKNENTVTVDGLDLLLTAIDGKTKSK